MLTISGSSRPVPPANVICWTCRGGVLRAEGDVAILIFPIGVVLGWFVRPPGRAAVVTVAIGVSALVILGILALSGAEVSPIETAVLIIGTPISAYAAFATARWRRMRRTLRQP
jgi:glucose-6-phosphate-specific signal transduction histidine kinase